MEYSVRVLAGTATYILHDVYSLKMTCSCSHVLVLIGQKMIRTVTGVEVVEGNEELQVVHCL